MAVIQKNDIRVEGNRVSASSNRQKAEALRTLVKLVEQDLVRENPDGALSIGIARSGGPRPEAVRGNDR